MQPIQRLYVTQDPNDPTGRAAITVSYGLGRPLHDKGQYDTSLCENREVQ